jgi:hypothetical protein
MRSPDTVGLGIFMLIVSCVLVDILLWNCSPVGGLIEDDTVTGTDPRESNDLERWARNTELVLVSVSFSQEIICSFKRDNIEPPRSGDGSRGSSSM